MHPLQKSWRNAGSEKAGRHPGDLSSASQGSSSSSKAVSMPKPFLKDEWVSYSAESCTCGYWAHGMGCSLKGYSLPLPHRPCNRELGLCQIGGKSNLEQVPWESKSQTHMPCTLVCSLTLPSPRLSLASCGQKLKLTEKIVVVTLRTVCTGIPLPAPIYLTLLGGQGCGSAVPLCWCFPGSGNEAEGEEIVCSTWRDSWLEERGIAPSISRCRS